MKKSDVVQLILKEKINASPTELGTAFSPTNIALCKYWGKRDAELNLPVTSSLSIALPEKGALTTLSLREESDRVTLNGEQLESNSKFVTRLTQYVNLFRPAKNWFLDIHIQMTIPVAAGLASSACGFASIVSALNHLFQWQLSKRELSILARLGSGSAARSLWHGFVEWHAGVQSDGMDSFAEPVKIEWPSLRVGILSFAETEKPISSRDAMQRTVDTSVLYHSWPQKVARDMVILRQALQTHNFALLGGAAESNALAMHATMLSSWPPVCYSLPTTLAAMQHIWKLRNEGLPLYFTQDAGPNLKLLFLAEDEAAVRAQFPMLEVVRVF